MATDDHNFFAAPRCPNCSGRIDTKPFRLGQIFATMFLADIATYVLAGVFVLLGALWEPAWIIALCLVVFVVVRRAAKQAYYVCVNCHREFTHKDLYASKQ